jgi:hypothetical protein
MMHRRDLKAARNIGFVATDSARALNVAGASFSGFFHHAGMSPQRIDMSARSPLPATTTSIFVVGAKL